MLLRKNLIKQNSLASASNSNEWGNKLKLKKRLGWDDWNRALCYYDKEMTSSFYI